MLEAPARLDPVRRELDEYFEGRRTSFDVPIDWSLTRGFTREVLQATARIRFGEVGTYARGGRRGGQPARGAGRGQRARLQPDAGGRALPPRRCARGGALGGYTGGIERKEFLLRLEGRLP